MERAGLKYKNIKMGKVPYFLGLLLKANSVIFQKAVKEERMDSM